MAIAQNKTQNWVLLRGLIRSQYHWQGFSAQLNHISQNQNVHVVEISGNGYLHSEDTPTNIVDVIDLLKKQLPSHLENYGLIGISLGGMLATKWSQLYPENVSHLVVINTSSSLSSFYQRLHPKNYFGILKLLIQNNPEQAEKFILDLTVNQPQKWHPYLQENINFLKEHPVRVKNFIRQLQLTSQVDFRDTPVCPKLVLTSVTDRLVSHLCSEHIAQAWSCQIDRHPSAGHDLPLDDENWVITKILSAFFNDEHNSTTH